MALHPVVTLLHPVHLVRVKRLKVFERKVAGNEFLSNCSHVLFPLDAPLRLDISIHSMDVGVSRT